MAAQRKKKRRIAWRRVLLLILCVGLAGGLIISAFARSSYKEADQEVVAEADNTEEDTTEDVPVETLATVMLDAGHGGVDGGTTGLDGTLEKDLTLIMVKKIGAALNEINPQINVVYTRTEDVDHCGTDEVADLDWRVSEQTAQNADFNFSIHFNANDLQDIRGFMFYIKPDDPVMETITQSISANLENAGWSYDSGTVYTDYSPMVVVAQSPIHSALIEMAFLTNPEDLAMAEDESMQDAAAKAIAQAISDYINANPDFPTYAEEVAAAQAAAQAQEQQAEEAPAEQPVQ